MIKRFGFALDHLRRLFEISYRHCSLFQRWKLFLVCYIYRRETTLGPFSHQVFGRTLLIILSEQRLIIVNSAISILFWFAVSSEMNFRWIILRFWGHELFLLLFFLIELIFNSIILLEMIQSINEWLLIGLFIFIF